MLLSHGNYRLKIVESDIESVRVPLPLDGYRICFLTDLHIGSIHDLDHLVLSALTEIKYDALLLGGDCFDDRLQESAWREFGDKLAETATCTALAVYGNHDNEKVKNAFSASGILCIENSGTSPAVVPGAVDLSLRIHGAAFSLAGLNNLKNGPAPDQDFYNILLTHSPEFAFVAKDQGYDLYICGHTHAGQICLPGGVILYHGARAPRRICAGRWRLGRMEGYTSAGIGTSVLPLRINCPPEISIITLRRKLAAISVP